MKTTNKLKTYTSIDDLRKECGPIIEDDNIDIFKRNFIYYLKNKITNMYYIGQSGGSFKKLIYRYRKTDKNKHRPINKAIIKFGLHNFIIKVVKYCNEADLDKNERYFIQKYNCLYPNGYNKNTGGKLGYSYRFTEEQKRKLSESRKGKFTGKDNPFYGKTHSKKTKEKIIESNKRRKGIKKGPLTDAQKLNLSKALTGKNKGIDNAKSFKWIIEDPNGFLHTIYGGFNSFCKINKLKSPQLLKETLTNKRNYYKGWKINEKISINSNN